MFVVSSFAEPERVEYFRTTCDVTYFVAFFYCFKQSAVCLYLLWGEGVICHFYESRENSVNIYDVEIPFINFDRGCFNVWRSVRVALMCDIDMLTLQLHLKRRRTNHV